MKNGHRTDVLTQETSRVLPFFSTLCQQDHLWHLTTSILASCDNNYKEWDSYF